MSILSACPCVDVSFFERKWYKYFLTLCVHVSVCHDSKGHGRKFFLICVFVCHFYLCPCVGVSFFKRMWYEHSSYSVCWCAGGHFSKGRGLKIHYCVLVCPFYRCVCVLVCHSSKGHGINIFLTLCVGVSFLSVCQCVILKNDMV